MHEVAKVLELVRCQPAVVKCGGSFPQAFGRPYVGKTSGRRNALFDNELFKEIRACSHKTRTC